MDDDDSDENFDYEKLDEVYILHSCSFSLISYYYCNIKSFRMIYSQTPIHLIVYYWFYWFKYYFILR